MFMSSDVLWMRRALSLAEKQVGRTAPNPAVGCVVVLDEQVITEGATADGGRPHAEVMALNGITHDMSSATLYVTLEPCCHQGKTGPCTDVIIRSGIKRVVVATRDPYEKVSGQGVAALKDAGVEVIEGVEQVRAQRINQGFFKVQEQSMPWVTLKIATSLDGKIATRSGESQWITNAESREYVHQLRSNHDAVLVGVGTVLADDPMLDCRLEGDHQHPVRVVLDSSGRTPEEAKIIQTSDSIPTWIMTGSVQETQAQQIRVPLNESGTIDLNSALRVLAEKGITRVLVEGGATIATSFLREGLVDQLVWCRAPIIIGNDGIAACGAFEIDAMDDVMRLSLEGRFEKGEDLIEVYNLA